MWLQMVHIVSNRNHSRDPVLEQLSTISISTVNLADCLMVGSLPRVHRNCSNIFVYILPLNLSETVCNPIVSTNLSEYV